MKIATLLARRAAQRAAEAALDASDLIAKGRIGEAESTLLEALQHVNKAISDVRVMRGRSA